MGNTNQFQNKTTFLFYNNTTDIFLIFNTALKGAKHSPLHIHLFFLRVKKLARCCSDYSNNCTHANITTYSFSFYFFSKSFTYWVWMGWKNTEALRLLITTTTEPPVGHGCSPEGLWSVLTESYIKLLWDEVNSLTNVKAESKSSPPKIWKRLKSYSREEGNFKTTWAC